MARYRKSRLVLLVVGSIFSILIANHFLGSSSLSPERAYLRFASKTNSTYQTTRTVHWQLVGFGVRELRARLMVYQNGMKTGGMESNYQFISKSPNFTGELFLVVQDGTIFDQPGKFSPWIVLSVETTVTHTSTESRNQSVFPILGKTSRVSFISNTGDVESSRVIFSEFLGGFQFAHSINGDVEDHLTKASAENRVAFAVVLEWE